MFEGLYFQYFVIEQTLDRPLVGPFLSGTFTFLRMGVCDNIIEGIWLYNAEGTNF